jgi:type II secretory pathway component GspD/PulD (secretin)
VKAYSALSLVALCLAAACGGSTPRLETRTFALHYLPVGEVDQLLRPYVVLDRPGAKGAMSVSSNTVTVRETADNLDRIARVLAQYDRPQPNVQLHFKIIRADGAARADSSIRDIESELRSLFRFTGYTLVADGFVTGSEGTTTRQTLAGSGGPYGLTARINGISGTGDSAIVHIVVEMHFPGPGGSFETSVGIPAGRTAVLGNVTGSTSNAALILTVRPDLVAN